MSSSTREVLKVLTQIIICLSMTLLLKKNRKGADAVESLRKASIGQVSRREALMRYRSNKAEMKLILHLRSFS